MGKAGWQVATAIFAGLSAMLGAAAWNTSRALDVANAQMSDPDVVAVYSLRIPGRKPLRLAGADHCVDGIVYMKLGSRLLSETDDGQPFGKCEWLPRREVL